jgi:pimeloyl-ACP methyl ester carboxylesterase
VTKYRTVEVEGLEVFYREAGDPAKQTILLLHGFPSSSAQYQELIDRLEGDFHLVAPDYPGFGYTVPLPEASSFERMAEIIAGFVDAVGLTSYALYVFDFGSPVGFRLATAHPERVDGLIIQNGNAYERGLGPAMQALAPYWQDRAAAEAAVRDFLKLEATRSQYVDGVPNPELVNPDHYTLDQHFLDLPGREQVMLDLFYDYQHNVALYPRWQAYLREYRPPTLIAWGANDAFFPAEGAHAYLTDVPGAELHLFDTGHIALETHVDEIAELITAFHARHGASTAASSEVAA